jgi:hypothetical protein
MLDLILLFTILHLYSILACDIIDIASYVMYTFIDKGFE